MTLQRHLILCGFMACGKSTVGAICASRLHVPFVDTDTLIVNRAGMSIPDIFRLQGEAAFRDLEHEVCLSLSDLQPSVIATGGGLSTFSRNVPPLRASGDVVFIDRSFDLIWGCLSGKTGRPLASGQNREDLLALFERRYPLYKAAASYSVISDSTASECANKILALPCMKSI